MKYKAQFKTENIQQNAMIKPDGFSKILIRNLSDANITILNNIVLEPKESFHWNEDPGIEIDDNILIAFTPTSTVKNATIMKVYYKEV